MKANRPDPAELDRVVAEALVVAGLNASFRTLVTEQVFDFRDHWRLCCGTGCDPCVDTIAKAVDHVRHHFGLTPPEGLAKE